MIRVWICGWKKWTAHFNWTTIFCVFYSGFRHHKWSRHEILQWFAEPNPRRIHFCALDTALYAGTGRWIDPGAFFPGGRPVVRYFISLSFSKNYFKNRLIIPECILLYKDQDTLDTAKLFLWASILFPLLCSGTIYITCPEVLVDIRLNTIRCHFNERERNWAGGRGG